MSIPTCGPSHLPKRHSWQQLPTLPSLTPDSTYSSSSTGHLTTPYLEILFHKLKSVGLFHQLIRPRGSHMCIFHAFPLCANCRDLSCSLGNPSHPSLLLPLCLAGELVLTCMTYFKTQRSQLLPTFQCFLYLIYSLSPSLHTMQAASAC